MVIYYFAGVVFLGKAAKSSVFGHIDSTTVFGYDMNSCPNTCTLTALM